MSLDANTCYAALSQRNAEFEGVFYVGVRTTGVFCRPTCPARPPKRENCEFFADVRQAMLASYRPCKRCRPLSHPNETSAVVRQLVDASVSPTGCGAPPTWTRCTCMLRRRAGSFASGLG